MWSQLLDQTSSVISSSVPSGVQNQAPGHLVQNSKQIKCKNDISFVLCFILLCFTHGHFEHVITFSFNTPLLAFGNSGEMLLNSLRPLFSHF